MMKARLIIFGGIGVLIATAWVVFRKGYVEASEASGFKDWYPIREKNRAVLGNTPEGAAPKGDRTKIPSGIHERRRWLVRI